MAVDEILINAQPGETRIALMDAGRLVELVVSRPGQESVAGNIYLGRVERVMSGLQAAFVEIGLPRAAFLALSEVRPLGAAGNIGGDSIGDYLAEGDAVVVQVQRDAFEDKGAKLTTRVALIGRTVIHTPGLGEVKISRRIDNPESRARLTEFLQNETADDGGFIARATAANAGTDDLLTEIAGLRRVWSGIAEKSASGRPPALLWRELDPVLRILRDQGGGALRRIVVDDAEERARIKAYCRNASPGLADMVGADNGSDPVFAAAEIEEQIANALAATVPLPSGGDIIISETPALTAIDVNTGGRDGASQEETAYQTNLQAAREAARQIRLRNLSGLLVIDFVPMKRRRHGTEVLDALRDEAATDPGKPHVIGFTRLGLVEMTRRKKCHSLANIIMDPCPACAGTGRMKSPLSVAYQALRAAERESAGWPGGALGIWAAAPVIEALNGEAAKARALTEERLGRSLVAIVDEDMAADAFAFGPGDSVDAMRAGQ
ncbi:MAG TPA: Rne/Rng family ribonuclease [Alphaproteobacteria bacterium]|nr:Rne/Rng family ribonuclease [Alphaproteobacteria bacterium]